MQFLVSVTLMFWGVTALLFGLAGTTFFRMVVVYSAWILTENSLKMLHRGNYQCVRGSVLWDWVRKVYPVQVEYPDGLKDRLLKLKSQGKILMFVCHPHGHVCWTPVLYFVMHGQEFTDFKPRALGANVLNFLPFVATLFHAGGAVRACLSNTEDLIQAGEDLLVLPGGTVESEHFGPDMYIETSRKGFLRVAMAHWKDVVIVPCFCPDEDALYRKVQCPRLLRPVQAWCRKLAGYPFPKFFGGFCFTLVPSFPSQPLRLIMNEPIFPKNPKQASFVDEHANFYKAFFSTNHLPEPSNQNPSSECAN